MKSFMRILSIALVACMALTFVSCGEKDPTEYVTLGQYKGLEIESQIIEVTDSDIQSAIASELSNNATAEEVTDRGVQNGDTATIDFTGYIDGEEFEGGSATDYTLEVGTASMIDGFVEGIIGLKTGESVSLDLKFPDNYDNADVAGKPVKFDITVKKIEVDVTPEYNDEFCKTVLGYDSMQAYEDALKVELLEEKTLNAEYEQQTELWAQIVENCEITDYPQDQIDEYVNGEKAELESYAEMLSTTFEDLLSTYYGMTEEEFNEALLSEAQAYVAESLIIKAIAKAEGLELTEDEYNQGVASYAEAYGETVSDFEEYYGRETIEESILWVKVVNFALENAVEK